LVLCRFCRPSSELHIAEHFWFIRLTSTSVYEDGRAVV
jgi:hypothetical protein